MAPGNADQISGGLRHWRRRGQTVVIMSALLIMALLVGGAALIWRDGGASDARKQTDLAFVKRGSFEITIPVTGELVALHQIEVRNQLPIQAVITFIAEEGTLVNAGDALVKFNDEELAAKLQEAIDEVTRADAAVIAAKTDHDVLLSEQESEIAKAELAVYLADLVMRAWTDREHESKLRRLQLAVETAEENFDRVKLRLEASEKLLEAKFISTDEFRNDRIAMIEAASRLEQANIDLDLYQNYEAKQSEAKKKSDLDQAEGELARTRQRFEARVHSARSELESRKQQLVSRKERQRLLEQQVGQCSIAAPSPGLVVYASSMESGMWRWGEGPPRVGSQVWPNQEIIVLPDTSRMAAEVKVSEALSGMIRVGQSATITADAMPDRTLHGEVVSTSVLASSGGWRDPNRREYTVRIALNGINDIGLKPAMRCKANIRIERVHDALHVPLQAIFRSGALAYVYTPDDANARGVGFAQREATVGRISEIFAEITSGLAEGERVLLRQPQPHEIAYRLPEIEAKESAEEQERESPPAVKAPSETSLPLHADPSG
jgi:HlyD family secretion protein